MKNFQIKRFFNSLTALSRKILFLGVGAVSVLSVCFVLYALFGQFSFFEAVEMKRSLLLVFENWLLCLCVAVGGAFFADVVIKSDT